MVKSSPSLFPVSSSTRMPLLPQVVGGRQTGRPGTHYRHLPAGIVLDVARGRLSRLSSVIGGIALQGADRDRIVHFRPFAGGLTGTGADPAQDPRKRNTLPDHRVRLSQTALSNEPNVERGIHVGGTC